MEAGKLHGPGWTPREAWFHLPRGRAQNICVFPTLCLILYIYFSCKSGCFSSQQHSSLGFFLILTLYSNIANNKVKPIEWN